ncbi:PaRep2b protein, partial [Pyrobaculum aerophilum]|uniref:PaRep2b protein n=1 Tax=Pyrobaculum aerophilum TaxID=13773 RepID=UPI0023F17D45
ALRRLEEIAKARGFSEILEEYLKPAIEAETVDPRGLVVEVERGLKAVVRDVRVERDGDRPRVVVEYEVNGEAKSFSFIWGVRKGGIVMANVWLVEERAAVLATLTGDQTIRGEGRNRVLSAKHLFALARFKGVGWELLRWYTEAMKE